MTGAQRRPYIATIGHSRNAGFTLMELMIVLVILAVILSVALPSFRDVTLATRLTNYSNELVASVYAARGEAIKRNSNVRLCATSDGTSCATTGGWAQGWIVLDPNDTVLQQQPALQSGFSLVEAGGTRTLTFDSTGYVGAATSFKACRKTPTLGKQERQIAVSTIGRTSVTRSPSSSCP